MSTLQALNLSLVVLTFLISATPTVRAPVETMGQKNEELLGDPAKYPQVITTLQQAIKSHDAALVEHPIKVTIAGKDKIIKDAKLFVAGYDKIITPEIAAAVEKERYEDLFVNYRGVVFGNGELWISGICGDKACEVSDVKIVAIQSTANLNALAPAPTADSVAQAQPLKRFKEWTIGCNNLRTCTALGLMAEEGTGDAYVKIRRAGAGDDLPTIAFTFVSDGEVKAPTLSVMLDGKTGTGVPSQPLKGSVDGDFVTATLTGDEALRFGETIRVAKTLNLRLKYGSETTQRDVSLAGSTAALLYMDEQQRRLGTVTALVRRGDAPSSSIPPVPEAPALTAHKLSELAKLPPLPQGVTPSKDESCQDVPNIAVRLSSDETLWGICAEAAAYNTTYDFWIADKGPPKRAVFAIPGRKADVDPAKLVNPGLSNDGLTINAFYKGRGPGDCGEASDWVWDGQGFKLLRLSEMDACGGVNPTDWPILFQAKLTEGQ